MPDRTARRAAVTGLALTTMAFTGLTAAATPSPTGEPSASTSPSSSLDGPSVIGELADAQTSQTGVDVRTYGVTRYHQSRETGRPAISFAVHGVQRVEGATVVYLSAGFQGDPIRSFLSIEETRDLQSYPYDPARNLSSVRLLDRQGDVALSQVANPETSSPAWAFGSDKSALPTEPGVMGTLFAVLPELPEGTTVVDVQVGLGMVVPDVPVTDGFLEPAEDPETVIPLGTGWPEVDPALIAKIKNPELSVHPLSFVSEALDKSSTTTLEGEQVTIDLAADVLFAVDEATLSPKAKAKIAEVAATINADAAPGALTIIGHTDNQGSDSYNDDLSTRRAEAVAAALRPLVRAVDVTYTVEGRGEREPVADNSSAEGRQANRRVAIGYTLDGGDQ